MPDPERDPQPAVIVTVLRIGGFAGIRRMWRVSPNAAEQPEWVDLIASCPWDAAPDTADDRPASLPDRFTWRIHARARDVEHTAELGESSLSGAWRQLVERVREDGEAVPNVGAGPNDVTPDGTGRASPVA